MSSINTNYGAISALSILKQTNTEMMQAQERMSSGLKVAGAKDDASSFSMAQGLRTDLKTFSAIKDSLSLGQSTVNVAAKATETIDDLLGEIKKKIVQAKGENVDRDAIQESINELREQIASQVESADFNGTNLLNGGAGTFDVMSGYKSSGETDILKIAKHDLRSETGTARNSLTSEGFDGSTGTVGAGGGKKLVFDENFETGDLTAVSFSMTTSGGTSESFRIDLDATDSIDDAVKKINDALEESDNIDFQNMEATVSGREITFESKSGVVDTAVAARKIANDFENGIGDTTYTAADSGLTSAKGALAGVDSTDGQTLQSTINSTDDATLKSAAETYLTEFRKYQTDIAAGATNDGAALASAALAVNTAFGSSSNSADIATRDAILGDGSGGGTNVNKIATDLQTAQATMDGAQTTLDGYKATALTEENKTHAGIVFDDASVHFAGNGGLDGLDAIVVNGSDAESEINSALTVIDKLSDVARKANAAIGSAQKRMELQADFVNTMIDSMKTGLGSLVDADLTEESVNLKQQQAKQQLGFQALGIANQSTQSLLGLFR